jgi:hypothetical protein
MAEPRQTRDSQTRTEGERVKDWAPPQILPTVKERDGWVHRWVRTGILGKSDNINVSARFREGWEPCKAEDYPEVFTLNDRESRFPGSIEIGGLLLCKAPKEAMEARAAHYRQEADNQMAAVDNNLMKQNDPRMPLFKEGKSTVSFGSGKK